MLKLKSMFKSSNSASKAERRSGLKLSKASAKNGMVSKFQQEHAFYTRGYSDSVSTDATDFSYMDIDDNQQDTVVTPEFLNEKRQRISLSPQIKISDFSSDPEFEKVKKSLNSTDGAQALFRIVAKHKHLVHRVKTEEELYRLSHETKQFCSFVIPDISVEYFLTRLIRLYNDFFEYPDNGEQSLGIHLLDITSIYIDRMLQKHSDFEINMNNVHRLYVAGFLVALKVVLDMVCSNQVAATIAGVTLNEINCLEKRLLFCLEFDVMVVYEQDSFEDFRR